MPSNIVNRLPQSLWQIIFQLVCTDGGRTGCTLAFASKAFRRASTSARFYSVRLRGLRHVQSFLACLERIRDSTGEDPPVTHLLLSFMPKTYDDPTRVSLMNFWTDYPGDEGRAMFTQPDEFAVPVTALLARAADTLRTLVVLQRCDVRLPPVRCHLPALRELALLGNDGLFMHASPLPSGSIPGTDDHQGAPFPNLQRLHVVYTWPRSCSWEDTLPRWSELAPAVTHLRISQGGAKVAQMVRDMLELSMPPLSGSRDTVQSDEDGTEPDAAAPALTYPSLRLVIVQPSRAPYSASSATAAKMLALRREVEEVAAVCAEEGTSMAWVSVLRSRLYDAEYWPRRLQREWRDRMMGGGGCWTEDEYDEDERWGVSPFEPLPKRDEPLVLDLRGDRPRDPPKPKKWWHILCSWARRKSMVDWARAAGHKSLG